MSARWRAPGIIIWLVLLALWTAESVGAQSPDIVTAAFEANPSAAVEDETEIAVTIRLTGNSANCPVPPGPQSVDAVLVIDLSTSMREDDDRLTPAIQAGQLFVSTMGLELPVEQGGDQVGLVTFSTSAEELVPLTQDASALIAAINSLDVISGTNIAHGIEVGTQTIIDGATQNPFAARVMVLLSDGEDLDVASVNRAADFAKAAGIRLITLNIGGGGGEQLQSIASNPEDFINVEDVVNLPAVFEAIAQNIQPTSAASNLSLTYQFDTVLFELIPNSDNPPASVSAGSLTWTRGELRNGQTAEFSFRLTGLQPANSATIGQLVNSRYEVCDTTDIRPIDGSGPVVNVFSPTPLPPPTATPLPPPTNTPAPTPTQTPPAIIRDEIAPAPVTLPPLPRILGFCDEGIWTLLPWLLALVLLLIWFFWSWWRYRVMQRSNGRISRLCWLAWTLVRFYVLTVLWLFLLPLFSSFCEGRESVYFWRRDTETRQTGIFLTASDQETYSSFSAINNHGCVGCHTVSNASRRIAVAQGVVPFDLAVFDFNGTMLDVPPLQAYYMSFSPDGERLAVGGTSGDIEIVDLRDSTVTKLEGAAEPNVFETMPSWGSKGEIAFVRGVNPGYDGLYFETPTDIYIVSENGGTARALQGASGSGFNYYPSFSPDAEWVAFTYHDNMTTYSDPEAEIYTVPTSGGTAIRIRANDDTSGNPSTGANSWPSWSGDGSQIAFNSQRNDSGYDLFTAAVNPDGDTGSAIPLAGASERGVFEHLPFWGLPASVVNPVDLWLSFLPCLIPIPLLLIGAWLLCRPKREPTPPPPPDRVIGRIIPPPAPPEPLKLEAMRVLWQPSPTLIIGLGETGRWTLTHIKKSLLDAGLGKMPNNVRFLLLDTGDYKTLRGATQPIEFGGVTLADDEVIELKDNLSTFLRNADLQNDPQFRKWLPRDMRSRGEANLDLSQGAKGDRILARAGLLYQLRRTSNNFFTRLLSAGEAAKFEEIDEEGHRRLRLFVTIIADTYGDVGSAALFDAAILAREVGKRVTAGEQGEGNEDNTTITAHIVTDYARALSTNNRENDQANTGATLREIERFQLAEARPFPIFYAEDQIAERKWDKLPIDAFYLYDGSNMPNTPLETGLLPMIADAVVLWMDNATRQGAPRILQNEQTGATSQAQRDTDQVHAFTQGIYTYRIPFADLLDGIRFTFEQEVFRRLIMGHNNDENWRLDDALNLERGEYVGGDGSPESVARAFLTGKVRPNDAKAPEMGTFVAMNALFDPLNQGKLTGALRRLESDSETYYRVALRDMLTLLLNGTNENVNGSQHIPKGDIYKARGGKLGYAIIFMEHIQTLIDDALQGLPADATGADQLQGVLESVQVGARTLLESLHNQAKTLGMEEGLESNLRTLILSRYTDLDERRKEMNSVSAVRRYIWEDATGKYLERVWYEQYIAGSTSDDDRRDLRQEALKQLYWQVDSSDNVSLVLSGADSRTILPGTGELADETIAEWEQSLLEVVTRYCGVIRTKEPPENLFRQTIFSEDEMAESIGQLTRISVPLAVEDTYAPNARTRYLFARSDELNLAMLEEAVNGLTTQVDLPIRLNSTDAYSISLNRRRALIEMRAITSLKDARNYYMLNHNLTTSSQRRSTPILTAVYEAEAEALNIESSLAAIRVRAEILHPVFVTALTDSRRALAYLLALAVDEVDTRDLPLDQRIEVRYTGDGGPIVLGVDDHDKPPLLTGLYEFLNNNTGQITDEFINDQIRRYEADASLREVFEAWSNNGWRAWADEIENYPDRYRDITRSMLYAARVYARRLGGTPEGRRGNT